MVGCLYWARAIFVPLAFAVFLAFLLSPFVVGLQRLGLNRMFAVLLVVLVAAAFLGGLVWLVSSQVTNLLEDLPQYTENIQNKVQSVRQWRAIDRLQAIFEDIDHTFGPK